MTNDTGQGGGYSVSGNVRVMTSLGDLGGIFD